MNWPEMKTWCIRNVTWRTFYLLLLGQAASFVLAITAFTSSLIAKLGVDAPLTQASFSYLTIAVVYGSIFLYRHQKPQVSWYWYLLLGFLDVQAIFLFNKAYQFTSITSVTLLDCFSIIWVIILTRFFLGTRYSSWQFIGAVVCVTGLGLVLISDVGVGGGGGSRPLLGDAIVIIATVFYSLSNVGEEFCVKNRDLVEVMCMGGVYGFLISLVEIYILEMKSVASIKWSTDIILALAGYTLSCLILSWLFSQVIKLCGATMYTLSVLTSDMWVVAFRVFFYHQQIDWLYYVAFAIVVVGLIIYSTSEKKHHDPSRDIKNGGSKVDYQPLSGENALPV